MPENTTDTNSADAEDGDQDTETTDSSRTRWPYTNDVLAGILVTALCITVAYSLITTGDVQRDVWAPFAATALLAAIWAFGTRSVEALKELSPWSDT